MMPAISSANRCQIIDEPHGPVADDELILVAFGRDHQFELIINLNPERRNV